MKKLGRKAVKCIHGVEPVTNCILCKRIRQKKWRDSPQGKRWRKTPEARDARRRFREKKKRK